MESERLTARQSQKKMASQVLTQMILSSSMAAVGYNLEFSLYIYSKNSCLCSVTMCLKFMV